jgi:hypothetical protein
MTTLHHDLTLDSLKKKLAQVPDPNPEKGYLYIWIMPIPI